ncbi:hypothetical protein [Intrasporangium sp. YIM S08009]|uniref:hypothetical protein n=1 Tax=Intrasporangium zincisolvens TaxID=3080018 RepID=UPI002B0625EE|nr:hypothetical protein [Intrasporangium sp. YIM S08009]
MHHPSPSRTRFRRLRGVLLAASAAALLVPFATAATQVAASPTTEAVAAAPATKHFITNLHGSTAPKGLGYDVFDTGASGVAGLPTGVQGLVWLGQKCPTPADATFRATVDKLAANPRVFGYYLSDEPHIGDCPRGPAALASRADYIRARSHGTQKSFIVLSKIADYGPFRPAASHVDLVGLDPYPCSTASPTCPLTKISDKVAAARKAGIPLAAIVPVFQTFGQQSISGGYYRLPSAAQMQSMLSEWHRLVPTPVMDYSYGWGHQSSSNPTLVDSSGLQRVMATHNG